MPETEVAPSTQVAPPPAVTTGVFDHLASPAPKTGTETKVSTDSGGSTTETKAVEAAPRLYAGRFKAPEELETAYGESTKEGLRLYSELQARVQEINDMKERMSEIEDRAKVQASLPDFREISDEALKKLAQEDPLAASRYLVQKELHERDSKSQAERLKADRIKQTQRQREDTDFIMSRVKDLASNPKDYPEYANLMPEIESISKKLGSSFQGQRYSADVAYLVALGRKYLGVLKESASKTSASETKASDTAKVTASASAPGGTSTTQNDSKVDPNSTEAVIDRILKAGSPNFFAKV